MFIVVYKIYGQNSVGKI